MRSKKSFKKVTLILSREFKPIFFIDYQRAFIQSYLNKVNVIEYYPIEDLHIKSIDQIHQVPAVIQTNIPYRHFISKTPTRIAIIIRDNRTCAYCGKICDDHEITIDHIIPKSKGGKWTWENLVVSCLECNRKKANNIWLPRFTKPKRIDHIHVLYQKYKDQLHPIIRKYFIDFENAEYKKEEVG